MIDFKKAEYFLDRIFLELMRAEIDVSYFELDHLCYRVESQDEYLEGKQQLGTLGLLLSENEIGGRLIATYKLSKPIIYQNREIFIIELPSPKEGSIYKTGFEHVEFVIGSSLENFMDSHPELIFKKTSLTKEINPDISLSFGDIAVKFHRNTLENIITFEQ